MKYTFAEALKDQNLVKIVNRCFHDLDAERYESMHPEIYGRENTAWRKMYDRFIFPIVSTTNAVILDVGTGAGFVIDNFAIDLDDKQTVIFSDISEKMLETVRNRFADKKFQKRFLFTDASRFDLGNVSVDIITVNSVLHHLPDYQDFLREADRVLRPGGILIIRHEPNQLFASNPILRRLHLLLNMARRKKQTDQEETDTEFDELYARLSKDLADHGIEFVTPLTKTELNTIIDIESATAGGGLYLERGFDPFQIIKLCFPAYQILSINTYAYLVKINEDKNTLTKISAKLLKLLFPRSGYLFEMVIKKS